MKMTKEEAFKMLQGKKVYVGKFTKEVQEKLFEIGFEWYFCGKQIMEYDYIIILQYGLQTFSSLESFLNNFKEAEEITISQILGIELEDEFKDGDILYCKRDPSGNCDKNYYIIYKSKIDNKSANYHAFYNSSDNIFYTNDDCLIEGFKISTEEQKQTLFNELDKQGYKWNSEEKKLEKKLWRAEYNGFYYIISDDLSVNLIQEENDSSDNIYYDIKNYFKTKDEAQQYADKIEDLLKNR